MGGERGDESTVVLGAPRVADVEIDRGSRVPVCDDGKPSDDDELDLGINE